MTRPGARRAWDRATDWLATFHPDRLTEGQRFTTAVAAALAVAVVVWGFPSRHGVSGTPAAAQTAGASAPARPRAPASRPAAPVAAKPVTAAPVGAPLVAAVPSITAAPPAAAAPTDDIAVAGVPAAPPTVVALVHAGAAPAAPGHDDTAVASYFLSREGLAFTTVTDDPADQTVCGKVSAAGRIVIAGWYGIDPALRTCLLGAGEVLVAFDSGGQGDPATAGRVVATRRGTVDTLLDLIGSPLRPTLGGHLGIVASTANRAAVQQALPSLGAAGVTPADVVYLDPAPADASQIAAGVLDFFSKGVTTVLFAASVDQQSRWAAQQAVLVPAMRYVVADTDDAVVNEAYAPVMDGATTYTAYRTPWYQRAHGETPAQTACRQAWESSAQPAVELSAAELADVFAWCEESALAASAMQASGPATPFEQVARSATVDSPLTSSLAPLPGGGYGPTDDAVLTWRASCTCWMETQPLTRRGAS